MLTSLEFFKQVLAAREFIVGIKNTYDFGLDFAFGKRFSRSLGSTSTVPTIDVHFFDYWFRSMISKYWYYVPGVNLASKGEVIRTNRFYMTQAWTLSLNNEFKKASFLMSRLTNEEICSREINPMTSGWKNWIGVDLRLEKDFTEAEEYECGMLLPRL